MIINDELKFTSSTLSSVCSLVTDGTHDTPKNISEGYPLIKAKEIVGGKIDFENCDHISLDEHRKVISRSKPEKGDILFAHIGASLGETAYVYSNKEFSIKNIALFKPSKDMIYGKYLYYLVISPPFQEYIKIQKTGSAQSFLSLKQLRTFRFQHIKSLPIQRKIAAVLSAYNDLIENNNRRIAILEKMAEELYREWFVRLLFPGHEKAKIVKGVPEGWEVKRIGEVVDRKRFGRIYREYELKPEGRIIVIDQSVDEYLGFYDGEPEHYASKEAPIIIFGDHSCKMQLMIEPFSLAENVIPFVAVGKMPTTFLFYLIHNSIETTEYKRHWTDLINKEVFIPTEYLQIKFAKISTNHIYQKVKFKTMNRKIKNTRDRLLSRLMSGRIDLENLDILFPKSMTEEPVAEPNNRRYD